MADSGSRYDVGIVGFGPVGAALAGLLGRRGVRTLVVEKSLEVFGLPRAAHIDHTGLRTLQELGLLSTLLPTMIRNSGLDFVAVGGDLLLRIPTSDTSVSGLPSSMYFYQPVLDRTLREAASAHDSVEVRLGHELVGLEARAGDVMMVCRDEAGGLVESVTRWVVGCDGAASMVRELMDMKLDDLAFEEPWLVADIRLPEGSRALGKSAVCRCDPLRPTYSIPMPFDRHRFEFMITAAEFEAGATDTGHIRDLIGPWIDGLDVDIERAAVYTFHGLVAKDWRRGRVLLAGDAAHQMPPFLGQGMCSGLRDASNLAWKFEHVLRHGAPDSLIDTYGHERSMHVRSIVEHAVAFGRFICTTDVSLAAQRDREMLADPRPPTMRMPFVLPSLIPGGLVLEGGGDLFVQPAVHEFGPGLDDRIGQRFAVLGLDGGALGRSERWWADSLNAFVATLPELGEHTPPIRRWLGQHGASAVVVRPDRYVMWCGDDLDALTARVAAQLAGVAA